MMASERQIAANRRNAQKSKGPKSGSGQKRSSKNAFRHGLSVPLSVRSKAKFKDLSRQFAGNATDAETLEAAEQAADADLELLRIRMVQAVMFERAWRLQDSDTGSGHLELEERRHGTAQNRRQEQMHERTLWGSELLDPLAPFPGGNEEEERRFIIAVNDALPDLIKTSRYEKRAVSRRDRAIHKIVSIKKANNKPTGLV
jgi:hypothetical protein